MYFHPGKSHFSRYSKPEHFSWMEFVFWLWHNKSNGCLYFKKYTTHLGIVLSQRKSKETWVCRNAFAPPKHSCDQITLLTFSHWKIPCSLSSLQTDNGRLSFYLTPKELKYLEDNCNVNSTYMFITVRQQIIF